MPPEEVNRLATLPPHPVLMAQLMGNMQAPLYALASVLNGTISSLAYALQARIDQLQPEPEPEEVEPEPAGTQTEPEEIQAEPVAAPE